MGQMITVAQRSDLAPGTAMSVEVDGEPVALFNVDGTYYAIGDTCTHSGGPLCEGECEGTVVTCPWHGATFDIISGEALGPPADEGVATYKVEVAGEYIRIEVP